MVNPVLFVVEPSGLSADHPGGVLGSSGMSTDESTTLPLVAMVGGASACGVGVGPVSACKAGAARAMAMSRMAGYFTGSTINKPGLTL